MKRKTAIILGIPVDDLDMEQTVDRIFAMVDAYRQDGIPRQVATVNVDFIVNTLSWRLSRPRHPELIDILRRSDLVTPDGMPIVWSARLLGNPIGGRVTGADLVPRLAAEAAARGRSIYFFGGRGDVGGQAARTLTGRFANLKVAGVDSPLVAVEGEALADESVRDRDIVERINRSGADILLIAFGNPKQEVWFDRNRHRLQVPVSIGIGGTYEFVVGSVTRAPHWMQAAGLEWVFRITQDPKRLWKRYLVGFVKFGIMILPSILDYRLQHWLHSRRRGRRAPSTRPPEAALPEAGLKGPDAIRVVALPETLDGESLESLASSLEKRVFASSAAILDFAGVTFVDAAGLGFLTGLWRRSRRDNRRLYLARIRPTVRRTLQLSRTFDLFSARMADSIHDALDRATKETELPPFFLVEIPHRLGVVIRLCGSLDAAQVADLNPDDTWSRTEGLDCILDLAELTFVDSSGIAFLLNLHKRQQNQKKACILFGMSENVRQMFRITRLERLFTITAHLAAAERRLEEMQASDQKMPLDYI